MEGPRSPFISPSGPLAWPRRWTSWPVWLLQSTTFTGRACCTATSNRGTSSSPATDPQSRRALDRRVVCRNPRTAAAQPPLSSTPLRRCSRPAAYRCRRRLQPGFHPLRSAHRHSRPVSSPEAGAGGGSRGHHRAGARPGEPGSGCRLGVLEQALAPDPEARPQRRRVRQRLRRAARSAKKAAETVGRERPSTARLLDDHTRAGG